MGLLARAALVDDDCLPLTFQVAPTRTEAADSSARSARQADIYLSEDPFANVRDVEAEVEVQTEAETQEGTQGANAAVLVSGFGIVNPEAFEGQDDVATAGVATAIENQLPLVNAGVSY